MNRERVPISDNIKMALDIFLGSCSVIGLGSGVAVTYNDVGKLLARMDKAEADVLMIKMSGHPAHEERLDVIQDLVRTAQLDNRDYRKDIDQIRKDISRLADDLKSQGGDIKANSVKSDQILTILARPTP